MVLIMRAYIKNYYRERNGRDWTLPRMDNTSIGHCSECIYHRELTLPTSHSDPDMMAWDRGDVSQAGLWCHFRTRRSLFLHDGNLIVMHARRTG